MTSPVESSVELTLLGISTDELPSLSNFPRKFNQVQGKNVWRDLLSSQAFARQAKVASKNDVWLWCVRTYLLLCKKRWVFPFAVSTEQSVRDTLYRMLVHGRRQAVLFDSRVKLMEKVNVLTTKRSFDFTDKSFSVKSYASLSPIKDPTFKRWLTSHQPGPMFIESGIRSGLYVRNLQDSSYIGTKFELDLVNYSRPVLLLEISCNAPVVQSNVNSLMDLKALTQYLDQSVWIPIVRAHRFSNTNNRLF